MINFYIHPNCIDQGMLVGFRLHYPLNVLLVQLTRSSCPLIQSLTIIGHKLSVGCVWEFSGTRFITRRCCGGRALVSNWPLIITCQLLTYRYWIGSRLLDEGYYYYLTPPPPHLYSSAHVLHRPQSISLFWSHPCLTFYHPRENQIADVFSGLRWFVWLNGFTLKKKRMRHEIMHLHFKVLIELVLGLEETKAHKM